MPVAGLAILLFALGGMALRITISPNQLVESMSVGTCAVLLSVLDFDNAEVLAALPGIMTSSIQYFSECYGRVVLTPQAQRRLFDYYFIQRPELHPIMLPFKVVDRHTILSELVGSRLEDWNLLALRIPHHGVNFNKHQLEQLVRTLLDQPGRCADWQTWMKAKADLGDHWHWGRELERLSSDNDGACQLLQAIDQVFAALATVGCGAARVITSHLLKDVLPPVESSLRELLEQCQAQDDASLGAYKTILAKLGPTLQQLSPVHNSLWRGKLLYLTIYHRDASAEVSQIVTEYLARFPPEALPVLILSKLIGWVTSIGFFLSGEQADAARPAIRRIAHLFPQSRLLGGSRREHLRRWRSYVTSYEPRVVQFLPTEVDLDDFVTWFGSYQTLNQVLFLPPITTQRPLTIRVATLEKLEGGTRGPLCFKDADKLLDALYKRVWARVMREGLLHKAELQTNELLCIRALARLLATDLVYRASLRIELPSELISFFYDDRAEGPPAFHELRAQLIDRLHLGTFLPPSMWKQDE